MSHFAVTREGGSAWTDGGIDAQQGVSDHATFMQNLAQEGFVLLAGPLSGTERGRLRVLLIIDADDEEQTRLRLADDPWTISGHLDITSIEPWNILVGAEGLGSQHVSAA
jgi:uncharacterized protein YciI